ncbi:MAG: hypothetical protein GF331_21015 [Chitinivibrionales bacterium]|nr:hypothetical protein [Chitinivibrionales bacterium]
MPYRAFMLDELKRNLPNRADARVMESGAGALVLTTYGARAIGLFPDTSYPNVLWNHEQIGGQIEGGRWLTGGERLWIAPERNFYYENPRDFDGFHVPSGFDPGTYESDGNGGYRNEFSLLDLSTNEVYDGSVSQRRFAPLDDPYGSGLPYTGARIHDSITVPTDSLEYCAWTISMVYTCGSPNPGTAFFPIKPGGELLNYFDPIPAERAEVRDGYARFRIDGEAVYKLAIAPSDMVMDTPCKSVYVSPYPAGDRWFCIVKRGNRVALTQDGCVDIPKSDPDGRRGIIQSYNHGPTDGPIEDVPFGEIELQLPRAEPREERLVSEATHELLAYAGTRDEMLELARTALQVEEMPLAYGD